MARIWRGLGLLAVAGILLVGGTFSRPAKADVVWSVNGIFQDGGTVSGTVSINVYGYISSFDLTTSAVGSFGGFHYLPTTSYWNNGTFYIDLEPGYFGALHLQFLSNLGVPSGNNPIVGGVPGPSYECIGSWSCYIPQGGHTRYIDSGAANVGLNIAAIPEPATWAMMILGFLGIGLAANRRRLGRHVA